MALSLAAFRPASRTERSDSGYTAYQPGLGRMEGKRSTGSVKNRGEKRKIIASRCGGTIAATLRGVILAIRPAIRWSLICDEISIVRLTSRF
jgi:hypothetical protein